MHELSLMEEVRRLALAAAAAEGGRHSQAIQLRVVEQAGVALDVPSGGADGVLFSMGGNDVGW